MTNETFKYYIMGLNDYSNQARFQFFANQHHHQKAYNLGRFIQ